MKKRARYGSWHAARTGSIGDNGSIQWFPLSLSFSLSSFRSPGEHAVAFTSRFTTVVRPTPPDRVDFHHRPILPIDCGSHYSGWPTTDAFDQLACTDLNLYVVNYVVFGIVKNTSVKDKINIEDRDVSLTVPHELNRADKRILRELADGVRNPSWLAEELDYSRQYVHQRLQLLVAAEFVTNLGHGLYELDELPDEIEENR